MFNIGDAVTIDLAGYKVEAIIYEDPGYPYKMPGDMYCVHYAANIVRYIHSSQIAHYPPKNEPQSKYKVGDILFDEVSSCLRYVVNVGAGYYSIQSIAWSNPDINPGTIDTWDIKGADSVPYIDFAFDPNTIQTDQKTNFCKCEMRELMMYGCKCGGK